MNSYPPGTIIKVKFSKNLYICVNEFKAIPWKIIRNFNKAKSVDNNPSYYDSIGQVNIKIVKILYGV